MHIHLLHDHYLLFLVLQMRCQSSAHLLSIGWQRFCPCRDSRGHDDPRFSAWGKRLWITSRSLIVISKRSSVMLFYSQGFQETRDQSASTTIWIPIEDPEWCTLVYLAITLIITKKNIFLHILSFSLFLHTAPVHSQRCSRKYYKH